MPKGNRPKSKGGKSDSELVLVIPNIRSAHNVGALFRTADGAGFDKVILCGYTPQLQDRFGRIGKAQKEIAKTALGAESAILSEYFKDLKSAIAYLKKNKFTIIGLEQDDSSLKLENTKDLNEFKKILLTQKHIALVVGEEVNGMAKKDLQEMDYLIELPMRGIKESLNVSVAAGVAMYLIALNLK